MYKMSPIARNFSDAPGVMPEGFRSPCEIGTIHNSKETVKEISVVD